MGDEWGCMDFEGVWIYWGIWTFGVCRCMEAVWMYGGTHMYGGHLDAWRCTDIWGCMDVWGCTDVWGHMIVKGCINMGGVWTYWGIKMYGVYGCMGAYRLGAYRYPRVIQIARHTPTCHRLQIKDYVNCFPFPIVHHEPCSSPKYRNGGQNMYKNI